MSKISVVLGFDCETDIGSWTPFYEGLVHGMPVIQELLDKYSGRLFSDQLQRLNCVI